MIDRGFSNSQLVVRALLSYPQEVKSSGFMFL